MTVRIWLTHSLRSAAPGDVQFGTPVSSSSPTVLSHSRWPASAPRASMTCAPAVAAAGLITRSSSVSTIVSLAQSASRFQTPQPPTVWRVNPVSL